MKRHALSRCVPPAGLVRPVPNRRTRRNAGISATRKAGQSIETLLTGSYQADALAPKHCRSRPGYVYSFTASGETTANAATLAITVDADPEKTTILSYGINGYGQNDATGQPQYSYFTRVHNQTLHLLAVLEAGSDRLHHAGAIPTEAAKGERTGRARRNRDAHRNDPCGVSAADRRRAAWRGRFRRRY